MSADWRARARCTQTDPELWFPEKGKHEGGAAKSICAECEVRAQCLAYALEHPELDGIWGGLTERERREPRRLLRLAS